MKYAGLVIENRSDKTDTLYTYTCDDDARIGQKVFVSFGRGKALKSAYIFSVSDEPEGEYGGLKRIEGYDENISLSEEMVRTCMWMKKRYLCRYIDAVSMFTPAGKPLKNGNERKPLEGVTGEKQDIKELTREQQHAIKQVERGSDKSIFLIHGVTGSGKTEIYMQLIRKALSEGRSAVMMVPEISLTKQIIDRFIGRFGEDNVAVLHSRLSAGERHDEWMRIRSGRARIVIGARSAVFAPLENVGLFILDEEHESTYKSETVPKYDTVEVAVKRAMDMGSKVVLGSATPSIVSYSRSEDGIYRLIELKERYNKVKLPTVEIVDMRAELKNGNTSVISGRLFNEMGNALDNGKQVILFLNRRGYSTFVSCRECGYVMGCPDCGISLTYHRELRKGVCHYCGRRETIPDVCPECGSKYIKYFGAGTEKVEAEVERLFPGERTARLDLDTMSRKGSLERILKDFGDGQTRILTGTQVVAKGLDFRNVGLVGIVSADASLNIPDYRSVERTFQLITQAAGRAGRGEEEGKVIIQTYMPSNYAVTAAANQDYMGFYRQEMLFRRMRMYPPYGDFIQIIIGGNDEDVVIAVADEWERDIRSWLGEAEGNVLPHGPMITPSKEGRRECILIKCPSGQRKDHLAKIASLKDSVRGDKRKYSVTVDVNPYSMWRS